MHMHEIGAAGWWARSFEVVHPQSPKSRAEDDMTAQHVSILEKFAAKAIRLGAEQLEVEYKDGYEELSAIAGDFGFGIGRLRSTSQEAAMLRQELYQCTRRKRQIVVDGDKYELHGRTYDSFGEQAYSVRLRRA